MSGVFVRRKRLIFALAGTLLAAVTVTPLRAETVTVSIDDAQTLKLPEKVSTIIIGNPLIADASLQSGGLLVITGKGFGSTNLLALDRAGKTVMNTTVTVTAPTASSIVVVYKGTARESYSCTPDCSPRITLGDDTKFFGETLGASGSRTGGATTAK
jgi:hypothetical protein